MSLKELKKVLTPQVRHADRVAVRIITRHVQEEETWKEAWGSLGACLSGLSTLHLDKGRRNGSNGNFGDF